MEEIKKKKRPSKFSEFVNKELTKHMDDFEKERQQALRKIAVIKAIGCLVLFFVIFINIYLIIKHNKSEIEIYWMIGVIFVTYLFVSSVKSEYKRNLKNRILPKILSTVGDFHTADKYDNTSREYAHKLKLFRKFDSYGCDDRIQGKYKLLDISISEIHISRSSGSGKHRSSEEIFDGLFITVPCNKKFKGYTIIKYKHDSIRTKVDELNDAQKVILEDTTFNKYYDVYSNDQVEARYLITTAFMERLKFLVENGIAGNINVSFELGNVNIAVSTPGINWFELPISQPANKLKIYKDLLYEILEILKIIDSLKLEQNIGL